MDNSKTNLDGIEAQRSKDVSRDKRKELYFHMKLLYKAARTLICSRGFSQSKQDGATPPTKDTEPEPELSELYNIPGEYVTMNSEILSAMRAGNRDFLENMKCWETPMACFKNDKGDSILHIAAAFGHLELVNSIVSKHPSLMLEPNWNDQIPLHVAARAGQSTIVKAFVAWITYFSARLAEEDRERLNPYVLRDKNEDTALHLALREVLVRRHCYIYITFLPRRIEHFLRPIPFSEASTRLIETAACLVNGDQCASFLANKDGASPLHLAVEAGEVSLVGAMLNPSGNNVQGNTSYLASQILQLEGRTSLVQAALKSKNIDVLDVILKKDPNLANQRDEKGRTCLSVGASVGFYEGLCMLLDTSLSSIFDCDDDGSYPIHMAVEKGHEDVFQELLKRFPDSVEQLNKKGQNILHIAAKRGKATSFLLRHIKGVDMMNRLMEEQDVDGNTPVHLATINWRPKTLYKLVYVYSTTTNCMNIRNADGLTPMDIAEKNLQPDYVFLERMTLMVLLGVHQARGMKLRNRSKKGHRVDQSKDIIQVLLVVATLVATVTFAAGFTIPGGFNSSAPNSGMAILVDDLNLTAFLISDALAMYSSIIAIVSLVWVQYGHQELEQGACVVALTSLFIALMFMCSAFCFGVDATIKHNIILGNMLTVLFVVFFIFFIYITFTLQFSRNFLPTNFLAFIFKYVNEDDN